mgnify:CR=1 FL=1
MLIKQLFQGKTYRETLHRRMWIFIGLDAVGIALIVLALTLLRAEGQDHLQGFYMGAGCGLALCGALFLVQTFRLLRDPAAAKKAQVSEQDEREQAIVHASMHTVFWVLYVVLSVGIFVALPLNQPVFCTLLALMALMTVSFFLSIAWYRKHM